MKYDNLLFNIYYLVLTLSLFYTEVFQRWKKSVAAVALSVLIFHSCANFCFLHTLFKMFYIFCVQFLAFLLLFAWFFAHILRANLSGSKYCLCYFVSFFHLCFPVLAGRVVAQAKENSGIFHDISIESHVALTFNCSVSDVSGAMLFSSFESL